MQCGTVLGMLAAMRLTVLRGMFQGRNGLGFLVAGGLLAAISSQAEDGSSATPDVREIRSLRTLATPEPSACHVFQIDCDVWWANPAQGRFVLHDLSGAEEVEIDLRSLPLKAGDRIRLTGKGTIVRRGAILRLGPFGPVVDHDGIHSLIEKSGAIFLEAGRRPLRLDWFNGTGRSGLSVEYEGPGISRQTIPEVSLVHEESAGTELPRFVPGLEFHAYEGAWESLPDFSRLAPIKSGLAANFAMDHRTRENHVGLQFAGLLDVSRAGIYRFYVTSDDGSRLFVGEPTLQAEVIGRAEFVPSRQMSIGQLLVDKDPDGQWATIAGRITRVSRLPDETQIELHAGLGSLRVEVAGDATTNVARWLNRRVRATGFCESVFSTDGERIAGTLLVPDFNGVELLDTSGESPSNGTLMIPTAGAVRELKPEEARLGYPLHIRGVVTCVQPYRQVFILQDSTAGLYCTNETTGSMESPEVGEFVDMEGVTAEPGIARAHRIERLGPGAMPEPIQAAWGQLLNGSMDSQYVEMAGLIESCTDRAGNWARLILRSRAGVLKVDVLKPGVKPGPIEQYENAVVRLRGCVFADWMPDMRLKVGQVRMYDVEVMVDRPAPPDLFSLPVTTAAALMRFDPTFDISRQVKVPGQIVYVRGLDYFVMGGEDGFRFQAREPVELAAGDLVEAVGYPEISGAGPILRGAVARKTGSARLPDPKKLEPDDLIRATLDATRVQIDAQLLVLKRNQTNTVFEMQAGARRFLARLNASVVAPELQLGSRLRLTGVYCAQGGYAGLGADFAPLDLLINSPADIEVLARPPWWTLQRLMVMVGVLACAVALMILWITQLRRQVEDRSVEITRQIQHREQVEHQRSLEQERARIAQDLHDQLGSDIATVSMLATRAQFASSTDVKRAQHLDQVRAKTREMVASLDEIVWAMNPGHDSLASLESYLGQYAGRFLGLANIAWRFEAPTEAAGLPVDSRLRHQLFLVFKEALNNVVRHSGATEVVFNLAVRGRELHLAVTDNGRGLPPSKPTEEMNGVSNMQARVEKLHGRFEINSEPGRGTTVRCVVPLS